MLWSDRCRLADTKRRKSGLLNLFHRDVEITATVFCHPIVGSPKRKGSNISLPPPSPKDPGTGHSGELPKKLTFERAYLSRIEVDRVEHVPLRFAGG
jgi:hypothetical protein